MIYVTICSTLISEIVSSFPVTVGEVVLSIFGGNELIMHKSGGIGDVRLSQRPSCTRIAKARDCAIEVEASRANYSKAL